MKNLLLALILVSFSALADCPNLAGKYATCRSESGEVTAGSVVTQTISEGVTTYVITSSDKKMGSEFTETIIADGVLRTSTIGAGSGQVTITSQGSCEGNALVFDLKVFSPAQEFANLHFVISKNGSQITNATSGSTSAEQVNDIVICE
jgi:hypothetical protein